MTAAGTGKSGDIGRWLRRVLRRNGKRAGAAALAVSLSAGILLPPAASVAQAAGVPGVPPVIVTEIVPDNIGTDDYEFFELHNTTDLPQMVTDSVYYRYTDSSGKADVKFTMPAGTALLPHETKVFWYNSSGKTLADFNGHFKTSLSSSQVVEVGGFTGFANGGQRAVVLKADGADTAWAAYLVTDVAAGLGVQYQADYKPEEIKLELKSPPTPGSVKPEQLSPPGQPPEEPVQPDKPVIRHQAPAAADGGADLKLTAAVESAEGTAMPTAAGSVYYRTATDQVYAMVPLTAEAGGASLSGTIPKDALKESGLVYFIQAEGVAGAVRSDTYTVPVNELKPDPQKLPELLVTEVVPDSTNVGSSDGYEFVEIYNNTDQPLSFDDYKLYYRYTDKGPSADLTWPSKPENIVIPARGTIVLWVINGPNAALTAADFNANYGSSLVEGVNLFRMENSGMANGGLRGLVVGTNTHEDISAAYYVKEDVAVNKGILYQYPGDGGTVMRKGWPGLEAATPGRVKDWQVPSVPVHVAADAEPPAVLDLTGAAEADQARDLDIKLEVTDNKRVKSVRLSFRTDRQQTPTTVYLTQDYNDTLYHHLISSAELIGKKYLEYSAEVSDGQNMASLPAVRVPVTGGAEQAALRLNVKDGQFVKGVHTLKGTSETDAPEQLQLSVDGQTVTQGTYAALEQDAYFAFEATAVDYYFKNAVTIGDEILYTFMDPIPSWKTLVYPIDSSRLKAGANGIWIRSGSKSGPFDDRPEENKDDFQIRNVRLILADGTELYDPAYADRSKEILMGDSAGKHVGLEFKFALQQEQLRSKTLPWDTALLKDGKHVVAVKGASGQAAADVMVDNAAPSIVPSVQEGQVYRGAFKLDAAVTDAGSGIRAGSVEALLDGKAIAVPYETSSAKLQAGSHTLLIRAEDNVGNKSERRVAFSVPAENPLLPELLAPLDGSVVEGASAGLKVRVSDPEGDKLTVGFYKGFAYGASETSSFRAFSGAADTEPPLVLKPDGERELTKEEYAAIAGGEGDKLTNDSTQQFPYHRFEVKLDAAVKAQDEVVLQWKGGSLPGRKVSLYAWSPSGNAWKRLDQAIAGGEDFSLQASVPAGDYAEGGMLNVLVQDELPARQDPYDFSFVWMSDTQYYSESWPEIYEGNTKWIMDNKDAMNIKYVIHTGDIVDKADREEQWTNAQKAMETLDDGGMPYGVLAGNHDVGHQNNDYSSYWKYYGEDRFKDRPYYGGSYKNNRGHYDLVSAEGNDFIIVYMGWGIGEEDIAWIDSVLQQYPERKAILAFHEYLLVSGNRAPIADDIYEHVVKTNKNVFAVLSGHYHDAETLVDEIDDDGDGKPDRKVYQMLADYQGAEKGGLGYIRLMQFDLQSNQVHIKTYSPYLDDYNYYDPSEYPGKDELDLDVNLTPVVKRVATDSMSVKVYTSDRIGEAQAASGAEASAAWNGLEAGRKYQWYAAAGDEYGGYARSDIWSFRAAGDAVTPTPKPSEPPVTEPSEPPAATPEPSQPPAATPTPPVTAWPTPTPTPAPSGSPSASPTPSATPGATPTPKPGMEFKDVPSTHWAASAISRAAALGIASGYADGSFKPSAGVSRAEFAVMLGRALGLQDAANGPGFKDQKAIPSWAGGYIAAAVEAGWLNGYEDGTFGPGRTVSRAEMAVIAARAMGLKGAGKPIFADAAKLPSWAAGSAAALQQAGLIQGVEGNLFAPGQNVTRAQAVTLILNMLDSGRL
ncbi:MULTISPECIES: S-layer homology domain-containing protein [unclassified Paenibacillus]|uniref:S-layer homology domain-containing protein n=1 Tax=unclassified Paenibacillus TaxID=185978 RepID=UPI000954BBC3|nr:MULTISPECIES: S-layer homology domain-containing protein [unclassified Paenibacillus]ASS67998.1 metallophosphoesterase [Paenibacillus sp. RUD330]SIR41890.1 Lamin Tail Domain [Paenibacillus sp. RU4X]SIR51966.1 Lamin Tail Domain [Paenibacillus sp. RU4T]